MVKNGQVGFESGTVPKVPFDRREGSAFGVEVLDLSELRRRSLDHSIFKAHRIEFHMLVVVTGGRGWHMVDFIQYPIERRSVVHIAPGQIQLYDRENDVAGFLVLFQPEVCGIEAPHKRWPVLFGLTIADYEVLKPLVRIMLEIKVHELSTPSDRVVWRMLPAVLELCEGAVAQHLTREGKPRSAEVDAFEALLDENFAGHRDLSWYTRQLGISQKTLSRWCRRVVGTNAKVHIDRRVALEAKRLLVHTDHTVESIAARLGFSEATNFLKFFKRIEGQTPMAFRQSYD